ncbi:MAG: DNA polymerase III subunit beta, partial [Bacteroidales bacterium]|nr:DNA polymerase III subunit beta [Bacteroidales bacterium]
MKIQKSELAKKIAMIQNIVPRKTTLNAIQGILVDDGYLIATDTQITMRVKLEALKGERFIIPLHAFNLISSLPEGEIEITSEDQVITIKAPKVSSRMNTFDADLFPLPLVLNDNAETVTVDGAEFAQAIKRVSVAVDDGPSNTAMNSMLLQAFNGVMNLVGLDGKRLAWEQISCDGDFTILVPKDTISKLKGMDLDCLLTIRYDKLGAVFETEEFSLTTRLVAGKYFDYERMFDAQLRQVVVKRKELLQAVERSRICGGEQTPMRFDLSERTLTVQVEDAKAKYQEEIQLVTAAPLE